MNMQKWCKNLIGAESKKAMPILSFPCIKLLGVSVKELISDSALMAKGMKAIADRCGSLAAVGMMDLSVESDAFGAKITFSDDEVPTVTRQLLPDEDAIDNLVIPDVYANRTMNYVNAIKIATGLITDRPVFAGVIGPFSLGGRLMDMSEIMVNCYIEPDFVHKTLAKATEFIINYVKAFKAAGANGILMAEPAAGLLSPDLIQEFSTPYVRRIIEAVRDDEFCIIYHNCGNTIPLIDSIKTIGANGYHFGNAINLIEALELMPKDVPVFGNIDPSSQFRNGTPESIYAATMKLIAECRKYDNFMPSSGCDIPPLAPWDNIDAFFKAVKDSYK